MIWPPDYSKILYNRSVNLAKIINFDGWEIAKRYYASHPVEFIDDWCFTFDPRAVKGALALMPFMLFPRQKEFIQFLEDCRLNQESGLIEKARDIGATWVCCAYSVWLWLFLPGSAVGWGSRKEQLVDRLGDPSAIFPKMRIILENLPHQFLPTDYIPKEHATYMRLLNPANGNVIMGEGGDNIGRGGRTSLYFKDEASHYARPELIEAALGDNTNVQIDISSVNGNCLFDRKRKAGEEWSPGHKIVSGITRVFIFDWSDHPGKTKEWYERRRAKAEREGLLHIFSQEVDRDSSASVEGVLIPAIWVKAALGITLVESGRIFAGFDVADEGGDKNALTIRRGPAIKSLSSWANGDVGASTRRVVTECQLIGVDELNYDCIGVGAGVKAETNRLLPKGLVVVPWSAAAKVIAPEQHIIKGDKDTPKNKDFYLNLKSQGGWELRERFRRTYEYVVYGKGYSHDELITIPLSLPEREALITELSQPTYTTNGAGKIMINKKPSGTKSPNLFDSCVMAFWPAKRKRRVLI